MQRFNHFHSRFRKLGLFTLTIGCLMLVTPASQATPQSQLPPIRPTTANTLEAMPPATGLPQTTGTQGIDQNDLRVQVAPLNSHHPDMGSTPSPSLPRASAAAATPFSSQPALLPKTSAMTVIPSSQPTAERVMVDRNIQPASHQAIPSVGTTNSELPRQILAEISVQPGQTNGLGLPMGLQDLLVNSNTSQQKQLVFQYWKTYQAWAEYRFALNHLRDIQQLGPVRNEVDRGILEAAQSAARDDAQARGLELTLQQQTLDQFIQGGRSASLPLPADTPLVGRYRTNFEIYSARQSLPAKMQAIHEWLPRQQELIADRAATLQRFRNAALQSAHATSQGYPIASAVQTLSMSRHNHTEFITSVVRYNQRIAEYALTVRPSQNAPDQIVAMLIPVPGLAAEPNTPLRQAALPTPTYGEYGSPPVPSNSAAFGTAPHGNAAASQTQLPPAFTSPAVGQADSTQPPGLGSGGFRSGDRPRSFETPAGPPANPGSAFRR